MIEDIKECKERGFVDLDGNPLSTPEFMRNIDTILLLDAVKDDDIERYLKKLGKNTINEVVNSEKTRQSLLIMQNGT